MHTLNVATYTRVLLFASKVGPCEEVWLKIALAGAKARLNPSLRHRRSKPKKMEAAQRASWRPALRITFFTIVANTTSVRILNFSAAHTIGRKVYVLVAF